jgi:hypothetical protein
MHIEHIEILYFEGLMTERTEFKTIAAKILGCKPSAFLGYKEYTDHVAIIAPDGKKILLTRAQLEAKKAETKPRVRSNKKKSSSSKKQYFKSDKSSQVSKKDIPSNGIILDTKDEIP